MLYELNIRGINPSSLLDHLFFLHKRKNISFNRELVEVIAEELDLEQKEFNKKVHDIGSFYWREYRDEGYNTVEDILNLFEKHNWFRAIKKNEGEYTLAPYEKNLCELFNPFLKGIFDQSPYEVKIETVRGKILLETTH